MFILIPRRNKGSVLDVGDGSKLLSFKSTYCKLSFHRENKVLELPLDCNDDLDVNDSILTINIRRKLIKNITILIQLCQVPI
jgi:hypothetical protein